MIIEVGEDESIVYQKTKFFKNIDDYYYQLIKCKEEQKKLINFLESYESSFTDFNQIEIISLEKDMQKIKMILKITDLLKFNQFFYKKIYVKNSFSL